jgi:hypothetical protein
MNCTASQNEIEELSATNLLSDAARTHVAACLKCAEFYTERIALRTLLKSLEQVVAPTDFDFKLSARLAAAKTARATPRLFKQTFSPGLTSVALASLFVIAICTAVILREIRIAPKTDASQPKIFEAHQSEHAPSSNAKVDLASNLSGNAFLAHNYLRGGSDSTKKLINGKRRQSVINESREELAAGRALSAATASASHLKSISFSSGAAPIIARAEADPSTEPGAIINAQINPAPPPVKIQLKNKCGSSQTFVLPRVSFGSQDVLRSTAAGCASEQAAQFVW